MLPFVKSVSGKAFLGLTAVGAITLLVGSLMRGAAPPSIEEFNGRVEAMRLDISTKYPGRIKDVMVHDGDEVAGGATIARMDDSEILVQISAADATAARARSAVGRAEAELIVRRNAQRLAKMDLQQSESMRRKELVSRAEVERRQLAEASESAGVSGAEHVLSEARAMVAEAEANITRLKLLRAEADIQAPANGRIEFVFVQKGAVLPAGGKIASLLQLSSLDMTVFLPAKVAGEVRIGDEARVKLDALPNVAIPAKVAYVAASAQFTPKYVETADERTKLVYKLKLALSPDSFPTLSGVVKPGMTGVAFIKTSANVSWPASLATQMSDR